MDVVAMWTTEVGVERCCSVSWN